MRVPKKAPRNQYLCPFPTFLQLLTFFNKVLRTTGSSSRSVLSTAATSPATQQATIARCRQPKINRVNIACSSHHNCVVSPFDAVDPMAAARAAVRWGVLGTGKVCSDFAMALRMAGKFFRAFDGRTLRP